MKKLLKLFLVYISIIIIIPNVNAFKVGEEFEVKTYSFGNKSSVGFPYDYSMTSATQKTTEISFEAYCLDRNKKGPTGEVAFIVDRVMPDQTSKNVAKYDYASINIINSSASYEEKNLAIRFLTDVIMGYSDTKINAPSYYEQEVAALSVFLKDSEFADAYNKFTNNKVIKATTNYKGEIDLLNGVKTILKDGLNFAANIMEQNQGITKISEGNEGTVEKTTSGGYNTYKKIVSIKLDIYSITGEGDNEYFKIMSQPIIEANNGATVTMLGVSESFIDSENGWSSISVGEDLSKRLSGRKGTLYLGFLVEVTTPEENDSIEEEQSEEDCSVKIKIEYEYTSPYSGAVLAHSNSAYKQTTQRFMIASTDPIHGDFTLDTSLCSKTSCDPTIAVPTICEPGEDNKVNEKGLVEYEFREAYNADTGEYNIKKCLLKKNSNDIADNSYKYIDSDNAEMVRDNPYCEVKCKEDYKFGVPYKKTTESGRYFQIGASIKGEQDCYTTKLDYNKYTEDIVKKQKEIIDTYNKWLENYENHIKLGWSKDGSMTCSPTRCTTDEEDGSCHSSGSSYHGDFMKVVHSNSFYNAVINKGDVWTLSVTPTSKGTKRFGIFTDTARCSDSCSRTGTCKREKTAEEDWQDQDSTFQSNILSAKRKLKNLIEQLRQIVDKYNSCVADHNYASKQEDRSNAYGNSAFWDMVYIYDPEVYYSYDEPEPNNKNINKWIEQVQSLSCDNGTCDVMVSSDELITAEKCSDKGSVKCNTSSSITDIDENTHPSTWYCIGEVDNEYKKCDGEERSNTLTTDDYNVEYHWMVLDDDLNTGVDGVVHIGNNLKNSKHLVTKVDYVHKIAESKGSYTTARVYFSGHDDGDIKIENANEIENYDLIDGLPVSINTPQGVYNYTLTLKNIGTYYNTTPEMGRIFDDEGNTMSNKYIDKGIRPSATKENGTEVKGNEYVCTYEVSANECTDSKGTKHYKTECNLENETWDECKQRLCPNSAGPYCVHDSDGYYVCDNNYYDSSCRKQSSREAALSEVGCTIGKPCEKNYNCCPNCTVECIGECVIKSECTGNDCKTDPTVAAKPQFNFKPISPGNIFPTDREIGYNWDISGKYSNSLVARKAKDTREEITARANDVSSETETGNNIPKVEDYSLKVTMDTNMINKIREYNQEQGTYNNDTMTCKDYVLTKYGTDEEGCKKAGYSFVNDKCIMSNIFCYSDFVDKLLDGDFGGEVDMTNQEGRTKAKEEFNKQYSGITGTLDNVITNDYWTIYSFTTLDTNGDGIPDVGPSWK